MAIPVILKGDTTATIYLSLADGYDYSDCWLDVEFCGVVTTRELPQSGSVIELHFTADETASFPLGTSKVFFTLRNSSGDKKTLPWAKIKVTDAPEEVASPVISIDPATLGDIDATAADSLGDVKRKLNQLLSVLRGGALCFAAALCLPALADIGPTTTLNDVPGTTTISNLVASSGAAVGGGGGISDEEKEAINTAIDSKVSKKGDTMTGPLTLRTTAGIMGGSLRIYGENGTHWSFQGAGFGGDVHLVYDNSNFAVPMQDIYDVATGRSGLYAGSWVEAAMENAAADATEALSLASAVSTVVIGEDCQLVSTNYNSATKMPSLFLRFQIPNEETGSNEWYVVWNELTRWNHLYEQYLPTNYYTKTEVAAELDQKADRAWGYYDSTTGNYAPEGFTWISSPSIAIAGGLAYQRVVTTEGAIWVLESNGMTTITGGETNGFFRISDDKGNAIFEIIKGTEVLVGATAGKVTASTVDGVTHFYIPYNVESSSHPIIEVCTDLKTKDWKAETDEGCLANVVWSGSSGAYRAEVWGKEPQKQMFVQAKYKKGQKDMIKNSAPVGFSEIVIDGVTYKVSVETMNGKKVMVLE